MNPTKSQARRAGLVYLLIAIVGVFGVLYVPSKLIVRGDATATGARIRAAETLFRLGIASELVATLLMIALVLTLHRLFKGINDTQSALMVMLVLVGVPIAFLNALNHVAALILLSGADFLSVFDPRQLDALAYMFLRLHTQGAVVANIFWGLWLFPFGVLVMRSGFIPRILGVLLIINCVGYVADSCVALVLPRFSPLVSRITMVPQFIGEIPMIVWLLIWGAKAKPSAAGPSPG